MEPALLIGNGLNRCVSGGISWRDLLESIAREYGVDYCERNPATLEFERIANQILSRMAEPSILIYEELKKKIAAGLLGASAPRDAIHHRFLKLPVRHFLTTNYDYLLETAYDPQYESRAVFSRSLPGAETKYSLHRQIEIGPRRFYHIHGEAAAPKTLCLGFEHYAGYLQKIRGTIHGWSDKEHKNVLMRDVLDGRHPSTQCWAELFFTSDLYILGFGFDQGETDLWWLLTYRAYLYYSNLSGMKHILRNRIVYFKTGDPDPRLESIFENLHVEYRHIPASGDYLPAYEQILEEIGSEIGR